MVRALAALSVFAIGFRHGVELNPVHPHKRLPTPCVPALPGNS